MISEKIIEAFSLPPERVGKEIQSDTQKELTGKELNLLRNEFPDFGNWIRGKTIVDFGCGLGFQTAALANMGAEKVLGLDLNVEYIEYAKRYALECTEDITKVVFSSSLKDQTRNYDAVISQNAMEHYTDPSEVLESMKSLIHDDGQLMITFGPPWYAPYGSHMHFFCNLPWVNILFPEKAVMRVRKKYRNDGANRYEEVESGLNKMSLSRFEKLCQEHHLVAAYQRYRCIKGLDFLSRIPILREFFVNRVTVILKH
ncbi:methyltransferase domain-containing protein [Marinobacter sp. ATCH36]|uniref:class I SAM-dependent methyltransferase n=1 Tax=Marinobacter sp. ATCH36 TaxID=2945106 RepID=UPI0020206373|nr:methyltransferase domain-containing protein [Marinobacter sp. ATCH36]MCL7945698.1 methyltransferase domain-containing protein [Marinobacter sp. ATCH36]